MAVNVKYVNARLPHFGGCQARAHVIKRLRFVRPVQSLRMFVKLVCSIWNMVYFLIFLKKWINWSFPLLISNFGCELQAYGFGSPL